MRTVPAESVLGLFPPNAHSPSRFGGSETVLGPHTRAGLSSRFLSSAQFQQLLIVAVIRVPTHVRGHHS